MKNDPKLSPPWCDSADIIAEFLARTGLIVPIVTGLGRLIIAVPLAVARWLGPEVHTPWNSSAARVVPTESGQFSGVLVFHRNKAIAWAMVRVDDAPHDVVPRSPQPRDQPPRSSAWNVHPQPVISSLVDDDDPYAQPNWSLDPRRNQR